LESLLTELSNLYGHPPRWECYGEYSVRRKEFAVFWYEHEMRKKAMRRRMK
jgi:hypothetical protein